MLIQETTFGKKSFIIDLARKLDFRCPEYDTFEGNKHTLAGTLHTCDGGNGNWNSCDRSGCQTNIFNLDSGAMCPESRQASSEEVDVQMYVLLGLVHWR